jgi:hypothetical protein
LPRSVAGWERQSWVAPNSGHVLRVYGALNTTEMDTVADGSDRLVTVIAQFPPGLPPSAKYKTHVTARERRTHS